MNPPVSYNYRCSLSPPPSITEAERLLHLARFILLKPRCIVEVTGVIDISRGMAEVKLALDLRRCPCRMVFRAIIEEWSRERIVRELY